MPLLLRLAVADTNGVVPGLRKGDRLCHVQEKVIANTIGEQAYTADVEPRGVQPQH